jgi:membrane-associated phospholipid phosphatase
MELDLLALVIVSAFVWTLLSPSNIRVLWLFGFLWVAAIATAIQLLLGAKTTLTKRPRKMTYLGGFPSAHATVSAFALVSWLGLLPASQRALGGVLGGIVVALIGYQRWAAGFHTAIQILAGWILGALLGFVFWRWIILG